MAWIETITCVRCKKTKNITVGSQSRFRTICNECEATKYHEKKQKHFEELDRLTIEERLRKIEGVIYDQPWSGNDQNTKCGILI